MWSLVCFNFRMLKRKQPPLKVHGDAPEEGRGHRASRDEAALVEESLRAIYHDPDGGETDFSILERKPYGHRKRAVVITLAFILFASIAAWVGFFAWQPFRGFHGKGLSLKIVGPSEIAIGGEEVYQIQWTNEDTYPLSAAHFRFSFPSDFIPLSFQPAPSDRAINRWDFRDLAPGAHGSVEVRGTFIGAIGSQSTLQAIGSYQPATFTRDFETIAVQPVAYTESVLEGKIQAPSKVLAGDAVTLLYTLINHGTQTMKGLVAQFHPPQGFVVNAVQATPLDGSPIYAISIGELAPRASSTIKLVGSFASGVSGDLPLSVEAGRRGMGGAFFPAHKTQTTIPVVDGDLSLRFVVNGSDADRSLQPGDPLHLTVAYQNTSLDTLKNISIRLGFESLVNGQSATGTSLLDWAHLETSQTAVSTTKTRVQTIVFEPSRVSDLRSLAPRSDRSIEISVPTLLPALGVQDAGIKMTVEAIVPDATSHHMVQAQPINVRYRTDADVLAEARYFTEEGAPLGFGPLPPIAGKTTAYRVFWRLSKHLHPLERFTVSARLPSVAAWSARADTDQGTIQYDPTTRVITWKIDKISDGAVTAEASFEVQVTPDANDIGRFAAILGETTFQAQDALLHEAILKVKPPFTTDLENDETARAKGVVRKS